MAALIAQSRVEGGIHSVREVIAGALLAIFVSVAVILADTVAVEAAPSLSPKRGSGILDPDNLRIVSSIAVLLLLLLINAFFAMAETAFISVRRTRIRQLAEEGNPRAKSVQYLLENPTKLSATTQVGITLVSCLRLYMSHTSTRAR